MARLDRYFFKSLPDYFKLNDTYTDSGKGLLERYLDSFQIETEEYLKDIEGDGSLGRGLATLIFPKETRSEYLNYIANFYGNPPDTFRDETLYRNLLSLIVYINKFKGTTTGIARFFAVMGVTVVITPVLEDAIKYDDAHKYDTEDLIYDQLFSYCYRYSFDIVDPNITLPGFGVDPPEDWALANLFVILAYLMPINARLDSLTYNATPVAYFLLNEVAENILTQDGNPLLVI